MRKATAILAAFLLIVGFQAVQAADCVEVDIELPATVAPLDVSEGYFELTNCGDEAATIYLSVDIDVNGTPFSIGEIPVMLAAGQTVSHEFTFIVPPVAAGATVEFCVTGTVGSESSTDCATVSIEDGSGLATTGSERFEFSLSSMSAADCVDLDLELSDTVYTTPGEFFAEGYFELINCGDEAATASLSAEVFFLGEEISVTDVPVELGAGDVVSREFMFPLPPPTAGSEFTLCVTATIGDVTESVCQTVVIMEGDMGDGTSSIDAANHPNPFNPSTTISFSLPATSMVDVSVINILGQEVARLVDNQTLAAGQHQVVWDGTSDSGTQAASGVYFYRIVTEQDIVTKKMLLMK